MSIPVDSVGSRRDTRTPSHQADFTAQVEAERLRQGATQGAAPAGGEPRVVPLRYAPGQQHRFAPVDYPRPPLATPDHLTPEREQAIDDWAEHKSDASGGFLGFGETSSAEHVETALRGHSDLGGLSPAEQRHLIDTMLTRWESQGETDAGRLADRVSDDAGLRQIVGERYAARAARLMREPAGNGGALDPHSRARAYTLQMLDMMGDDKAGLARVLNGLSPEDGVRFAQALGEGAIFGGQIEHQRTVLAALNAGPASRTTSAMVQTIFASVKPGDIMHTPEFRRELSFAIAREWHPDSPGQRDASAARLQGLMDTHQGQRVLFGGTLDRDVAALAAIRQTPSITADSIKDDTGDPERHPEVARAMAEGMVPADTPGRAAEVDRLSGILRTQEGQDLLFGAPDAQGAVPAEARAAARQLLLTDRTITADTLRDPPAPSAEDAGSSPWLERTDPWHNPKIVEAMARANAAPFASDEPITLGGTDLDNFVGSAMGARPHMPGGMSEADAWARAGGGDLSLFASGPDSGMIRPTVDKIHEIGGDSPRVTALPVTYSSADTGPVRFTLFRVETAGGERFVDHQGAVYDSFEHWRTANQLPPGLMVYPEGGHIATNADGSVRLASAWTPKTPDTASEKAADVLDKAALVGGIVAGGALIVGTGGTAGLVLAGVGTASGAWGAARQGTALYDRQQIGLSINPVTDGAARTLWLGVAANATGIGAFASEAALIRYVANGGRLAEPAALAIGTGRVSATVTNAAAFADAGVNLIADWGAMSPDERASAVLQMGFWGVTSAVGARQARSFGEMLNPAAAARGVLDAYQPQVIRDSTLDGSRGEIDIDPLTGNPVVRVGEAASPADVDLHVRTARLMARHNGLTGLVRQMFGEPPPGTPAHTLLAETQKIGTEMARLREQLAQPHLTLQQRIQIEGDIATQEAHLRQVAERVGHIAPDPSQLAIAALSRGIARAEEIQLGLGSALPEGYYWRTRGPDLLPEIVRTSNAKSTDALALVESETHPGTYDIKVVASDVNLPRFSDVPIPKFEIRNTLDSIGGEEGQRLVAQFDTAIAERARLVAERDALRGERKYDELIGDEKTRYDALNQGVTEQSQLIGELGAYAHVRQQFPGAEVIYGGPGAKSRPGDFDLVARQVQADGTVRFIVIEAKGGNAALGTRKVGNRHQTQGTREYFQAIAKHMSGMDGAENAGARETGKRLISALANGSADGHPAEVIYLTTRSGVNRTDVDVKAKQFDITEIK